MEEVMDKLVLKHHDGSSLKDLGYVGVGLDDNWQACGKGHSGSFHSADGTPLWNNDTFPDPVSMVKKAHRLGLKAGWCESRNYDVGCRRPTRARLIRSCAVYRYEQL